ATAPLSLHDALPIFEGGFDLEADGAVTSIVLQPDGRIVLGGAFTGVGGGGPGTRNRIARLNADGSLDSFNPGANGIVRALAAQRSEEHTSELQSLRH